MDVANECSFVLLLVEARVPLQSNTNDTTDRHDSCLNEEQVMAREELGQCAYREQPEK